MRCAIVVSLAAAAAAGSARADEYVVRDHDSCLEIVHALFPGDRQALAKLHALNPQLGPLPHHLIAGMRLQIPGAADARLTFVRPRVESRRRGQPTWQAAETGLALYRLDEVFTRPEASAEVTFADATRLHMEGDALIVIYSAARRVAELQKSGAIELVHGDLRLHLRELRGEVAPDLVVSTPAARVATDARDLLLSVDRDRMSRVSVHAGRADVEAQREKVSVARGFGTRVAAGQPPEPARPLPPAPAWTAAGARDLAAALGGTGRVAIGWRDVPGAAGYLVSIARDARMNDVVLAERRAPGDPLRAELPGAAPGRYHARVTAIDAAGLVGLPAERVVDVVTVKAERGAPAGPTTLRGTGELVVTLPDLADAEILLDGKPVRAAFVVRDVGRHPLRIAPRAGGTAVELTCEVVAPRARVTIAGGEVEVRLLDAAGAALAIVPGADLSLVGREGTLLGPLRQVGPGVLRARIESARRAPVVVALWEGKEIGRSPAAPPAR